MSNRARVPIRGDGFVLVGVVMLVLALTILGLSLFALSSYEAQFFNSTVYEEQAMQSAMGGLERAKYALALPPTNLENVQAGLELEYIKNAVASQIQGPDTMTAGPVDWDGEDIKIKVTAVYKTATRTVEAKFHPQAIGNYYKRLITSAGRIDVVDSTGGTDHRWTADLAGGFWQNDADTVTWRGLLHSYDPSYVRFGGVPTPQVSRFFDVHLTAATPRPSSTTGTNPIVYYLQAPPNEIGYLTWNYTPGDDFTLDQKSGKALFQVWGRVVWMLPRGIHVEEFVEVQAMTSDACLVIVAGNNGSHSYDSTIGVWFRSGMDSPDVPVILVSDGRVFNEQLNNTTSTAVASLSIFAGNVFIGGPDRSFSGLMGLNYRPSMSDAVIDSLSIHGALPNATVATHSVSLVPGTWSATP